MAHESKGVRGMNTRERILSLIEGNEESFRSFEEKFGLKTGTVSEWKRGRMFNYMDYLVEIADEYDVTTDWLLGRVDDDSPDFVYVFVKGYLRAGQPVEEYETDFEFIKLPADSTPEGRLYALRVIGDHLAPVAMDGDLLVIDKEQEKQSGRICLIRFDGETTVRRIKFDSNSMTIFPINPLSKEITLPNSKAIERGFYIEGVVYQLIRKF